MKLVRYESSGHVATITMDRASAHNALNPALCNALRDAWLRFRDSDDRVAVLASAEENYFCVGADVRDFPADMWRAVPGLGVELDKPVIAATSASVRGWLGGVSESSGAGVHLVSGLQTNFNHDRSTVSELDSLKMQEAAPAFDQPGKGHGCESEAQVNPSDY